MNKPIWPQDFSPEGVTACSHVTATETLSNQTRLDQTPLGFLQLVRTGRLGFKNLGLLI